MNSWIWFIIAVIFNIFANVLIKLASNKGVENLEVYFSWQFILGLAFFGLNLLFYTKSLANVPLAVAYPTLVGLSALGIAVSSFFLFEPYFSMRQCIGIVLLIISIYLISGDR